MLSAHLKRVVYLGVLISIFGVFIQVNAQDERMIGGVGITVFKDRYFRGDAVTYTSNVSNLDGTGFNDRIRSIRVGAGERWEVCRDANYRGRCVIVSGEEADLRLNSWDNVISSMRRVFGGGWTPPPQNAYMVLYTEINYRGEPNNYDGPAPYLNRRARSLTIGSGSWQFCEGVNFTGRCVTISQSIANLASFGLANRISSARPVDSSVPIPPVQQRPYIVLYSQTNYRGTPTNYSSAQPRISKVTGSITIGQGVWEVCTGTNFTGSCKTLNSNQSNFAIFGFVARTIKSLRPVVMQPR